MRKTWIGSALLFALLLAACTPAAEPEAAEEAGDESPAETAAAAVPDVTREELLALLERDAVPLLLDVRTAEEFARGHIGRARNISHEQIGDRLDEIGEFKERRVVLYCRSGRRAGIAASVLREAGFTDLAHLDGDMNGWLETGLPVEK